MDRRHFLKALGLGSAATVAGGCARDRDQLIPYVMPAGEAAQPGVTAEYATVCRECPAGCGMVARVRDGRCHKLEGNPDHPVNRGTLCLRGQAALQGLYNPDRFRGPMAGDGKGNLTPISWTEAERRLAEAITGAVGGGAAWIGRLETGALDALIDRWLGAIAPRSRRLRWETYAHEPLRAATARVFGTSVIPEVVISAAHTLVSFGADFLETWVSNVQYAREFARWRDARREGRHRGRYVWVGPHLPLTGANADEWIAVRPGTQALVARALAALVAGGGLPSPPGGRGVGGEGAVLARQAGVDLDVLQRLAREMASGPSLALPLGVAGTAPDAADAEEAILRLNVAAGSVGRTILPGRPHALSAAARYADLLGLIAAMRAGEVPLLFLQDANPAYSLPPAAGFAEALARVPAVVSFSTFPDETTRHATLVLPAHHFLESWGDYSPWPGVTGLMQPVVGPVFSTRPLGDLLLASAARAGRPLGAGTFEEELRRARGLGGAAWQEALARGSVGADAAAAARDGRRGTGDGQPGATAAADSGRETGDGQPAPGQAGAGSGHPLTPSPDHPITPSPDHPLTPPPPHPFTPSPAAAATTADLRLHVYPSLYFYDGRTANRPWAQEVPHPMAKAVWGSWAEIHPETARRLAVATDDLLEITSPQGSIRIPALVTSQVHPEAVAVQFGQGHEAFGRYASGTGVNPAVLLPAAADPASGGMLFSGIAVSVARAPGVHPVVILQTSERLVGEPVARSTTLDAVAEVEGRGSKVEGPTSDPRPSPGGAGGDQRELPQSRIPNPKSQIPERPSLYHYRDYPDHHWMMVIDLDRCIGCNACVAACYAENNVPVVGREECARGREMAWLRIENYAGEPETGEGEKGRRGEGETGRVDGPMGEGVNERTEDAAGARAGGSDRLFPRSPLLPVFLPMPCQHCDNAPCEYVCPVYATVHDDQGLNEQIYNRCVGTRYCSHNCPYKVRRFNWFSYRFEAPLDQQLNPDVLHRTKGVMEKCTFCIQRIRRHAIDAKAEDRPIRDGEVVTACAQTCPTDAIVFGDYKDPNSRVHQLAHSARGYGALAELNTYPNVVYLERVIRNA